MEYQVIGTGNRGNCVIVDAAIAIDMGVRWEDVKRWAKKIQLVLLTHEHRDHFKPSTLRKLNGTYPKIHFACPPHMLVPLCTEAGIPPIKITVIEPGTSFTFRHLPCGDLQTTPFSLLHNVPNVGWLLKSKSWGALYATDTQYIPISAPDLDLYLVECNYRGDELRQRKLWKEELGLPSFEDNIARFHMSFETVMTWLTLNASPHSKIEFLHQHVRKEETDLDTVDTGSLQPDYTPQDLSSGGPA